MPTGQIVYEPKILASGKTRRAIVRRHAHNIFIEAIRYLPLITGKSLKSLRRMIESYNANPYYWISRGNSAVPEEELDELMKITRMIMGLKQDPEASSFIDTIYMSTALETLEQDLIIPSKTDAEQWAILKVDLKTIQEQLEGLRGAGVNISGSAWGPHISLVRGEKVDSEIWAAYPEKNKVITFEIGELRKSRSGYYWYDINCKELELLRISLGLSPRPSPPFHLTVGKVQ